MSGKKEASNSTLRLSKLMSERGLCSRREADEYIAKGLVRVNGEIVKELGTKVTPDVRISLEAEALKKQKKLVTIIVNKPIGYVSGQPEPGYEPAIRLINDRNQFGQQKRILQRGDLQGLAVIGRLDIDSQGLLLFSQDGRLAKKIIGENSEIEKEYIVRVHYLGPEGRLPDSKLKLLNHGLSIEGQALLPAKVEWINEDQLRFILKEGKKRQIRKMCEQVGLQVKGLKRVRIGKLALGKLPEGRWRFIEEDEEI
ncbi:pseudouridine synthase [Pseudobdellovibrio exovorus]|uniref:Pseudouridylate synthase n=1 Tax=Pseudobdellovibrio exovorus JSS TaxID=1184267 RepID=M4V8N0_9BACT|nr:pseudouridine synthase [Pseudobdellovibrio exovorus]AGH95558.1 pseudouridylate synthase [Pseudobdellovibrio exovorus JSS]